MGSQLVRSLQIVILFIAFPLAGQNILSVQLITINSRNVTVNQVLDEIALQTGYNFTFNAALIEGGETVRFRVTDLPLAQVLDSLLGQPGLVYRVIGRNIVIHKANESVPSPLLPELGRTILKGRIMDGRTGDPLDYASVALFGTSLGTVSNLDGGFSFKIPGEMADPLLVVSYMGYKNRYIAVDYPLEGEIEILLEKETIPLQEVIIRFTDPAQLLNEARQKIPSNYIQEHATMTAYYRESVKRNNQCKVFTEAVLEIAKSPYSRQTLNDQVRIRKGRKITDLSSEDTVIIKLHSGIHSSLTLDVVKNPPDFLSDEFSNLYDLEFSDMMTYGDRLVYVISFKQKSHINALLFRGEIYLDQEHLTILAADFEYNPQFIHREPDLFLVSRSPRIRIRPVFARYHVDYRAVNGLYHVNQVRAEVEMKVRRRRQWIRSRYTIAIEMAVTDITPGERLRIGLSERVKHNTVLADQTFEFDPLFWGIHNTIEPEASLLESIRRIEHNLQRISD